MNEVKKLAITGANGYLGLHSIKAAVNAGWEVNAIIRREEVVEIIRNLGANPIIVRNFNIEKLEQAFRGCKAVLHFANVVCGTKELFDKINVNGLKNVIEAAHNQSVSRVIYPSGLGVNKIGIKEWADNDYFKSKKHAEELLQASIVSYVIFRPSYILGPNDELIPELIEQISNGIVIIAGDGNVPMQPIYVKDAVKAFLAAADGVGEDNQIYNLIGPNQLTMNELVEMVNSNLNQLGIHIPNPEIKYISYDDAPEKLEICKEMVDVMKCDLVLDSDVTAQKLNLALSPIDEAIRAAVIEELCPKFKENEKRAIILLSGGIDSATSLFWAKSQGYKLKAISFNYQYRPKKEIEASRILAEKMGVDLIETDIPFIAQATDLLFDGFPIISAFNAPEGYIPLRNLIFYSIAAFYAEIYNCKYIIGGHTIEDPELFSDSSISFFKSLEKLIMRSKHKNTKGKVKFIFPLSKLNKLEVLKLAKELKVPLELTWSCYGDFNEPCGKCLPCKKRDKAIRDFVKN